MKKVLWISYVFPPLNCGVGRQVKIAKYLPNYGWLPIVLSVKRSKLRPLYDVSTVKDIADNVEVYRTWSFESALLMRHIPYFLHLNPKWLQIPDPFIGWFPFAVREGQRIIRSQKVDAIFSSSLPSTCHLVANALKQRTGLPWVADFRDLWTQNTYVAYPRLVLKIENKMEAAVVSNAERITTINEPMTGEMRGKYPDQPSEKFVTVSHGFDPEDFRGAELYQKASPDKFTMTYTGSLYGKRNVDMFLYAIKELIDEKGIHSEKINIRFVGNVSSARSLCHQLGLNHVVTFSEVVPHEEAWAYLFSSDALLLVQGTGYLDEKGSTGKLFEYLAIGKPVLALAPESVAASIIRQANIGLVVNPEDKEGIKRAVREMYTKWLSGSLKVNPNKEVIKQYDVRELSGRFAMILDELVQGEA